MKRLHITDTIAVLPLDVLTNSTAILAIKGGGKTYTGSVIAEELLGQRIQVVVLDPTGVWWGLRSSADGKGAGFPIHVFGGEHADIPLEPTAGAVVADAVVEHNLSVILDLSQFDTLGAQRRFAQEFAERLHRAKAPEARHTPLALFIDEADEFVPQRVMGEQARMVGAFERIVKRDRIRGIWTVLISQRSAAVNKDVLSQCHFLIAHQTVGKHDRSAIADWVEFHGTPEQRTEMMASIAALPVGGAWLCEPRRGIFARAQVRRRTTFDSSATPEPGQRRAEPSVRADVDLSALGARIAATVEKAKADDPRELRRRIAELERQVAAADAPGRQGQVRQMVDGRIRWVDPPPPERIEVPVPVMTANDREHLFEASSALEKVLTGMRDVLERTGGAPARIAHLSVPERTKARQTVPEQGYVVPETVRKRVAALLPPTTPPLAVRRENGYMPPAAENGAAVKAGGRRMLEALARSHPMRFTRAQLATMAKVKRTGGTFGTYFGVLRGGGYITEADGLVSITAHGLDFLGVEANPEPMTPDEVLAMWRSKMKAGARRMLDVLVADGASTREALALAAGITQTGGTFGTYLGHLRTAGLIEIEGAEVRLAVAGVR